MSCGTRSKAPGPREGRRRGQAVWKVAFDICFLPPGGAHGCALSLVFCSERHGAQHKGWALCSACSLTEQILISCLL